MRTLAFGDIHGYSQVFRDLLEMVQPAPDDQLITLGDYVDRGPDSRGVLDLLVEMHARGNLVALRGNHDSMMLQARSNRDAMREWLYCGGETTLDSYGTDLREGMLTDVPDAHWHFLEEDCTDWHEIDSHFFVHANATPDEPLEEQSLLMLHWEALYEAAPHCSGKVMVCGHTKQKSGLPRNWGHAVCIDTWVYGEGWLTCLDVKSGKIWQANRRGERREGWLPEPEEP